MAIGDSAGLLFRIKGDESDAVRAFKNTESAQNDLTGTTAGLASSLGTLVNPATLAAAGVTAITSAAIAGVTALYNLAKASAEYGDQIFDTAQKTNVSTDAIQAWNFAAEQSGSSTETVNKSLAKFSALLGQAADGNDKAQAILEQYNITATDTDEALIQAVESIMAMTDANQQNSAAAALFKDRGGDVINMIREMNGDLPGTIKHLRDMGILMGEDDVEAAAEFTDQMDLLDKQLAAVGRTIGSEVLPVFMEMATEISDWLKSNPGEIKFWAGAMKAALQGTVIEIRALLLAGGQMIDMWSTLANVVAIAANRGLSGAQDILVIAEQFTRRTDDRLAQAQKLATQLGNIGQPDTSPAAPSGTRGGGPRSRRDDDDESTKKRKPASDRDTRSDRQVYNDFVRELGKVGVQITSGFRTHAQQAALFARLPKGEAAVPGTSDHEFFKAVDLPPGVSRELLEKAALAAGVTLGKGTVHQGTGLHRHQTFKKGRSEGGGEAELERERVEAEKRAKELQAIELKFAEDTERRKFAIGQASTRHLLEDAERQFGAALESGRFVEAEEAARTAAELRVQLIRDEITELQRLYQEKTKQAAATADAVEKRKLENEAAEAFNKVEEKTIQLVGAEADATVKLDKDLKTITKTKDEQTKSWNKYVKALIKARDEEDEAEERRQRDERRRLRDESESTQFGRSGLGGGLADELGIGLVSIFGDNDAIKDQGEFLKDVFADVSDSVGSSIGMMVQGMSQMLQAWIMTGEFSAKAALQMAAGVALGLAQTALMKGIFEVAEGIAASAQAIFNPAKAAEAALHFAAAKVYFTVAAIAGAAGVGLALGARAAGGGAAGGGSRSPRDLGRRRDDEERDPNDLTSPFSGFERVGRQGQRIENPLAQRVAEMLGPHLDQQNLVLGRMSENVEMFTNKFGTVPAGHVVAAGADSRNGRIAIATANAKAHSEGGRTSEDFYRETGVVR